MAMTAQDATQITLGIAALAPIIPVLVIKDLTHARPLAEALVAGGLPALEVTLRTPDALAAIRAMAEVPGGQVGAGTLLTPEDVRVAKAAGATFGVSPGATGALVAACEKHELPLIAGAATASEAMAMLERGYRFLKFFPAETSGGAPAIKALGGPLPQISFCPTGGVSPGNVADYLGLSNVVCAGGSWVAPANLMAQGRWDEIEALARDAAALPRAEA